VSDTTKMSEEHKDRFIKSILKGEKNFNRKFYIVKVAKSNKQQNIEMNCLNYKNIGTIFGLIIHENCWC